MPEVSRLRVEGQTDSVVGAVDNRELSRKRADADTVIDDIRPDPELEVAGYGAEHPAVQEKEDDASTFAANRRIEIHREESGPGALKCGHRGAATDSLEVSIRENRERAQMRARRVVGVAVVVAAVMGGCSANAQTVQSEATQDAAPPQESAPAEPVTGEPFDDAALCVAYGDVISILENVDIALDEGRMEAQEHRGWYQLATRVLDRLPSDGDGTVAGAIADLQEIAPAIPAGAAAEATGVRSPEWLSTEETLGVACDEVGSPLTISVFTGG